CRAARLRERRRELRSGVRGGRSCASVQLLGDDVQAEYRVQAARGTAPARGGGSGPGDVADAAGFGAGGGARMDLADPQAQPGPELDVRAQSVLGAGVV